ncbi:MAG: pilus assembly protein Flp/PilA [Burkholderiaceae bacterium]
MGVDTDEKLKMTFIKKFMCGDEGVTAIEYALIGALIAAAIAISIGALGTKLDGVFTTLKSLLP